MSPLAQRPPDEPPGVSDPGWFKSPDGVWLRARLQDPRERARLLLSRDRGEAGPVAVINGLPSGLDQMHAFADERLLGLPTSTREDQAARLAGVGFEDFALFVSLLGLVGEHTPLTPAAQLGRAKQLFITPGLIDRIRVALASKQAAAVFSDQQLVGMIRIGVAECGESPMGSLTDALIERLERALVGMSSIAMSAAERLTGEPSQDLDMVAFLVQAGAFTYTEPLVGTLGRVIELFARLAQNGAARVRGDFCDLAAWAREDQGMTIGQLIAAGFAAAAGCGALGGDPLAPGQGLLAADWAIATAGQLKVDDAVLLDALSADRAWYAARFTEIRQQHGVSEEQADAGWMRAPLEERPFLRLEDGRLLLWSPRALIGWLTEGFYYRALCSAQKRRTQGRFFRFYAHLIEDLVVQDARAAFPEPRPSGSGRAHGDRPYPTPHGEVRTPDLMLDFGQDIVLVEVQSGRLRPQSKTDSIALFPGRSRIVPLV